MNRTIASLVTLAFMAFVQTFAGAELVLVDGLRLSGISVERRGGEFLLETSEGALVVIERELVREIRLTGEPPILCDHRQAEIRGAGEYRLSRAKTTDFHDQAPVEETRGQRQTQPSLTPDRPRTSGSLARPRSSLSPTPTEQLAAFGRDPATFQDGSISPTWRYDDVLGYEKDVTQFSPSRWYRTPIDPDWRPDDVLSYESDVTRFRPSTWYRSSTEAIWHPTDGWRRDALPSRDE